MAKAHPKASKETLKLGFTWAEGEDRYSQSACEAHPLARRLAATLENGVFHHVPDEAKAIFRARLNYLFDRIPVKVLPVGEEPYNSCEEMSREVTDRKVLRVRDRRGGVGIIASAGMKWRAVHDFYGHVQQDAPFSLSGELMAAKRHMVQFPRVCWPGIHSNVVLENAFRLNRGHFLCYPHIPSCPAKVVFDDVTFGQEQEFYREALMGL